MMGQYKFALDWKLQIGFLIYKEYGAFVVQIPFIQISFGLRVEAFGVWLFNHELKRWK